VSLPSWPIPYPGFERNPGMMPETGDTRILIQFANGWIDPKPYKASDFRNWKKTGSDWDIAAIGLAEGSSFL
jgi:hypothetical protein